MRPGEGHICKKNKWPDFAQEVDESCLRGLDDAWLVALNMMCICLQVVLRVGALIWAERERALATGRKRSIEYYIMAAVNDTLENRSKNLVPMMIPDLDVGPPTEQGALMQQRYRNAVSKAGSAYK